MTRAIQIFFAAWCCASAPLAQEAGGEIDEYNQVFGAEKACFAHNVVDSMKALDDRFIYLRTKGTGQHYLLALEAPCPGLRGDLSLGIERPASPRICPDDRVGIVYSRFGPGQPSACIIRDIVAVDSLEQAESLVEMLVDSEPRAADRSLESSDDAP